jgi:hypothetical protein
MTADCRAVNADADRGTGACRVPVYVADVDSALDRIEIGHRNSVRSVTIVDEPRRSTRGMCGCLATADRACNDGQMIEAEVVRAFVVWLEREGWSVRTEVGFIDVVAERNGLTLLAGAKGTTTSAGLDIDTAYGQLLRRLNTGQASERYALVVPTSARKAAERVGRDVRSLLRIALYVVADDGSVALV